MGNVWGGREGGQVNMDGVGIEKKCGVWCIQYWLKVHSWSSRGQVERVLSQRVMQ